MKTIRILNATIILCLLLCPILYLSCNTAQEEVLGLEEDASSQVQFSTPPGDVVTQTTRSSESEDNALVIARRDPNTGKFRILVDKLSKELSDGTPVKYFAIRTTDADYGFIRIGQDADGNYKSEAFRSKKKNGKISVVVIEQAVWYTTCFSPKCLSCMPNSGGSACECEWREGLVENPETEREEVVIVDFLTGREIKDIDDTDTDCTFGGGVGSLFPNEVIK